MTRLLVVPLAIVPCLAFNCGGDEATRPAAPTASATTAAPPASTPAAAAEAPPIECPAPKPAKPDQGLPHPAACPDLSTPAAVAKLDFAKAFKVNKKLAGDLKENAAMTVALRELATRIGAAMKDGCTKLLADFGCSGDFGDVQGTCDAAANVLGQAQSRLGPTAKIAVTNVMPRCTVASQPALDCLKKCAPTFKGKADALQCDGTSGASGCDGVWFAPGISDACTTTCAIDLASGATCTPTEVHVTITNASDAKAADQLRNAVEKDLHGAFVVEAARGRIDAMVKRVPGAMKALGPEIEKLEKANNRPIVECYDLVTTDETLQLTELGLESMLNVHVNASAVLPKAR